MICPALSLRYPDAFSEYASDELVGSLVLGGVTHASDLDGVTFGRTASSPDVKNDAYFSGTGVIRLAPILEPSSLAFLGSAGLALIRRRRGSSR